MINFISLCPIQTLETCYVFNIVKENFIHKDPFDFLGMTFYLQWFLVAGLLACLFVFIRGVC